MKRVTFSTKKIILLLTIFSYIHSLYANNELKVLTDSLHRIINEKQFFVQRKEQKIASIKLLLDNVEKNSESEYRINVRLYDEYKKFQIDSALFYTNRNVEIARRLNNPHFVYQASLQLAYLYSLSNRFLESKAILESIPSKELSHDLLITYYTIYCVFYTSYSVSIDKGIYMKAYELYQDSLMCVLDHASFEYRHKEASYYITVNPQKADTLFSKLLKSEKVGTTNYAMITGAYSTLCKRQQRYEEEQKLLILSAITDIRNATRENESMQMLALKEYENQHLGTAFKYAHSAIEDIVASGVHFHAVGNYKFNSLVNSTYQEQQAQSRSRLAKILLFVSLLLLFLVVLLIYIYKQKRKISVIRQKLEYSNEQLSYLNQQLKTKNVSLSESNQIKEYYITEFFDMCFNYIHEMERYQSSLYKIAIGKRYEELIKKLKSTTAIDQELDNLYKRFDTVFLTLYPTFIADFNNLLKEEERGVPKWNLLNRELRVYALLRLGIQDAEKLSTFLCCSISTIYCYRTKMRNKALNRDTFESDVMKIGTSAISELS